MVEHQHLFPFELERNPFKIISNTIYRDGGHFWISAYFDVFVLNQLAGFLTQLYVTGFAKRDLPHTSDLQTSTIHNFECVKAMGLQNLQCRVLTWCKQVWGQVLCKVLK